MEYKFTFEDGSEVLAHYGVLGMRWGVRHDKEYKSEKKGIKKSDEYKGFKNRKERKNAINDAKVRAADRLYSTNSTATNRKIQTRSTAKTLGMSALYSSYGALHYDRARTGEGYSRGKAFLRGYLSGQMNNATKAVIPFMGIAGTHNYIKDRQGRQLGRKSGSINKKYVEL